MADQAQIWSLLDSASAAEQRKGLFELVKHRHAVRKIALSHARKLHAVLQAQQPAFNETQSAATWAAAVSLLTQWILQPGTYKLSGEPRLAQQLLEAVVQSVLASVTVSRPPTNAACAAAHFLGAAASGVVDLETKKDILQCVVDLVAQDPQLASAPFIADINSALVWLITAVKDDADQVLWAVAGACLMWARYVEGVQADGAAREAHLGACGNNTQVPVPTGPSVFALASSDLSMQSLLYARHLTHRLAPILVPPQMGPVQATPGSFTEATRCTSGGTVMETLTLSLRTGMLQQHEPAVSAVCCLMTAGLVEGWAGLLSRREVRQEAIARKLQDLSTQLVDSLLQCASTVQHISGISPAWPGLQAALSSASSSASCGQAAQVVEGAHSRPWIPQVFAGSHNQVLMSGAENPPLLPPAASSLIPLAAAGISITFVSPHLATLRCPPALPLSAVIASVDTLFLFCNNLHGLYASAATVQLPATANAWLASHSRTGLGRLSPQVGRLVVEQLRFMSFKALSSVASSLSAHAHRISAQHSNYLLTTPHGWSLQVDHQLLRPHLDRLFATAVVLLDVALSSAQQHESNPSSLSNLTSQPTHMAASHPPTQPTASSTVSLDTTAQDSKDRMVTSHTLHRPIALVYKLPVVVSHLWQRLSAPQYVTGDAAADSYGLPEVPSLSEDRAYAGVHGTLEEAVDGQDKMHAESLAGLQQQQQTQIDGFALLLLGALSHLQFCKVSVSTYDQLLSRLTARLGVSPCTCTALPGHLLPPYAHLTAPVGTQFASSPSQQTTPQLLQSPAQLAGQFTAKSGPEHAEHAVNQTHRLNVNRGFRLDDDIVTTASLLFLLRLCPLCIATTACEEQTLEVARKVLPYVFLLVNHPVSGVWEEAHAIYTALVQGLAGKGSKVIIEESLPYYVHISVQGVPDPNGLPDFSSAVQAAMKALPPTSRVPLLCIQQLMAAIAALTSPVAGSANTPSCQPWSVSKSVNETSQGCKMTGATAQGVQTSSTSNCFVPATHVRGRAAHAASHLGGSLAEDRGLLMQHTSGREGNAEVKDAKHESPATAWRQEMVSVTAGVRDDALKEKLVESAAGIMRVVGDVLMVVDYDLLPAAVQLVSDGLQLPAGSEGVEMLDTLYTAMLHCHDYARKPHLLNWCLSLYS